jgi:hypothetical protein
MSKKITKVQQWFTYEKIAFISIAIGFSLPIIIVFLFPIAWYIPLNNEATGAVGSFLSGVVGPFWTLASVFLFYKALIIQSDQLKKQEEELTLQRKELAATREVFEIQKFENTFFNLLSRFDNIQRKISYQGQIDKNAYKSIEESQEYYSKILKRFTDATYVEKFDSLSNPHDAVFLTGLIHKKFCYKNPNEEVVINACNSNNSDLLNDIHNFLNSNKEDFELKRFEFSLFYQDNKSNFNEVEYFLENFKNIIEFIYNSREESLKIDIDNNSEKKEKISKRYETYFELFRVQINNEELGIIFNYALYKHIDFPVKILQEMKFFKRIENLSSSIDNFIKKYPSGQN